MKRRCTRDASVRRWARPARSRQCNADSRRRVTGRRNSAESSCFAASGRRAALQPPVDQPSSPRVYLDRRSAGVHPESTLPSLEREQRAWREGRLLIGVDEAGRGPLAGPVVAAAVVFPEGCKKFRRIRDSKTLPESKRDVAADLIRQHALAIGVGAASVREIDRLNILRATVLAMRRAITRVHLTLPERPAEVVLDGLAMPGLGYDHDAIVDGDALCLSISAAGIIAKTVRDRLMVSLDTRYPSYRWLSNRGYGTEAHRLAIDEHGPTAHHRRSFMPVMQLGLAL